MDIFFPRALQEADVIMLLGARLNWILHFGHAPRFSTDVKIIQVTAPTQHPPPAYTTQQSVIHLQCTYYVGYNNLYTHIFCKIDFHAEEMGVNIRPTVPLLGDIKNVMQQVDHQWIRSGTVGLGLVVVWCNQWICVT